MYSPRLRVFTQLAFVAVLVFMLAAVPAVLADSRAQSGPVSPDMLLGQAAQPASAAGLGPEMAPAAADIFVDDDYTSSTPGWGVTAFDTVQGGVNGATPGNTVLVYPGDYVENVNVDRALTLQSYAGTGDFASAVNLCATQASGCWYTDRYAPGVFATAGFGGGSVLQHGVRVADSAANRPSGYSSAFYNTQGRKLDTNLTGTTQAMTIDLWVDSSWVGNDRSVGLWATGFDGSSVVSAYPILAFRNSGVTPGFYTWDYALGVYALAKTATAADYGRWHTLSFVLTVGTGVEYFVDGVSAGTIADLDTTTLGNVILNVYNFGADHDVYWDNFQVRSATPAAFLSAITGQMTIAASDVTVDGFYLTNPAGKQAIYAQDRSDITIKNNIVTNVGSSDATTSGTNFGMAIVSSAAAVDGITITDNRISQIVGGNKKSADGIAIGWSTGNELITGLLIKNNAISNITSDIGEFSAGGRGAYGILISHGTGTTGKTVDAQVLDNTISNLEGLWAHGIGLEGNTPNALVRGNKISTLVDHKTPSDAVAVQVEDNLAAGTVNIDQNCFSAVKIGVQNVTGILVDADNNWWGDASGPYNAATNPGGSGAAATVNVDFNPWIVDGCGGSTINPQTVLSATTADALICTDETTTVNIDLAEVVGLYGYQFEVSYDPSLVTASGAFLTGLPPAFFDVDGDGFVPGGPGGPWDAKCSVISPTEGKCSFAKAESGDPPVSGTGTLARITLIGKAVPGAFNMAISNETLSDIDGTLIYHNLAAPLPITVCGKATVSGFITMQGRPGDIVDPGTVTMIEQASPANFTSVLPVPFNPANGAYSIVVPYMPGGSSYKILAEHDLYLDNADVFNVTGPATKSTRLWGGDAVIDGRVNIQDLSCIGDRFGATSPVPLCGPVGSPTGSPDINADGRVNIQDLSITGGNFDKCGAQPWDWVGGTPVTICP